MFCTWMFHWKSYLMCTRLKIIQISLIYGTTFLYLLTAFTAFESEKAEEPPSTLSKRHSGWRWECPVEWFPAAKLWMGLCLADLLTQLFHWRCVALQLPVELSSFFKRLDWTNGDPLSPLCTKLPAPEHVGIVKPTSAFLCISNILSTECGGGWERGEEGRREGYGEGREERLAP